MAVESQEEFLNPKQKIERKWSKLKVNQKQRKMKGENLRNSQKDTIVTIKDETCSGSDYLFEGQIYKDWTLINKLLRLIGSFPFTEVKHVGRNYTDIDDVRGKVTAVFEGNNESESLKVKVKEIEYHFISWATLYSITVDLFRIFWFFVYMDNWGVLVLGREFENRVEDWIVKSMNITLPLNKIWSLSCFLYTAPKAANILNQWQIFEQWYSQVFPKVPYKSDLRQWRRLFILSAGVPTSIASVSAFANLSGMTLSSACRLLYFICVIVFTTLDEARVLVNIRTATEAFRNFHVGIKSIVRGNDESDDKLSGQENSSFITIKTTKDWHKMLRFIRKQVVRTGEMHSPQQGIMIAHNLMFYTHSLFILFVSIISRHTTTHMWICTILSTGHLARLVLKVIFAEQITNEEQKIEEELSEINPEKIDISIRFELKKITDVIRQNPCKLVLGRCLYLERRLIVKFIGYVFAYMVILFQFQLATNYSPRNGMAQDVVSSIALNFNLTELNETLFSNEL